MRSVVRRAASDNKLTELHNSCIEIHCEETRRFVSFNNGPTAHNGPVLLWLGFNFLAAATRCRPVLHCYAIRYHRTLTSTFEYLVGPFRLVTFVAHCHMLYSCSVEFIGRNSPPCKASCKELCCTVHPTLKLPLRYDNGTCNFRKPNGEA